MKIDEQFMLDHSLGKQGAMIHRRTFDAEPSIEMVKRIREQGFDTKHAAQLPESYLVGRVPGWMINEWLKEAGVRWDDPAAKEVVFRKLRDRDNAKFRVWGGNLALSDMKR